MASRKREAAALGIEQRAYHRHRPTHEKLDANSATMASAVLTATNATVDPDSAPYREG